jgi:hypothetical protein
MARYDIKLKSPITLTMSVTPDVVAGGTNTILAGEPTKAVDAVNASPYLGTVEIMVDGNGTTSQRFTGIAKSDSNDAGATTGEVELWMPLPGLIYEAKAKTASTADTAAEVKALFGKRVVFDLTAGKWTVDAAATGAATNGVVIVGGDYQTATLYFEVATNVSMFA